MRKSKPAAPAAPTPVPAPPTSGLDPMRGEYRTVSRLDLTDFGVAYFKAHPGYGKDPQLPAKILAFWEHHFDTKEVLLRARFRHGHQRGAHTEANFQRDRRVAAKQLAEIQRLLAELNAHHRPVVVQRMLLPFCQAALTADKAANTAQRATVFIKFR